jgi:hypothetical protein
VERHAVALVAVLGEGDPVEVHPVPLGDPLLDLAERRVAVVAPLPGAQPGLVDPALVAEHPALLPAHRGHQLVVDRGGVGQHAPDHVDPGAVVELDPLDGGVGVHGRKTYRRPAGPQGVALFYP